MPSHTSEAETTRVAPFVRRKKSARVLRASAVPCGAAAAEEGSPAKAPKASASTPMMTVSLRILDTSGRHEKLISCAVSKRWPRLFTRRTSRDPSRLARSAKVMNGSSLSAGVNSNLLTACPPNQTSIFSR